MVVGPKCEKNIAESVITYLQV